MSYKQERLSHAWGYFGFFIFCVNVCWAAIQAYHFFTNDSRFQTIVGSILATIFLAISLGAFIGFSIGFVFFACEADFYWIVKSQRNYRSYGSTPDNTTEDLLANNV